jgi:DNA-binding protein H-NS
MATLQSLNAKIQSLERQAEALRANAVRKVRNLMSQLGVKLEHLAAQGDKPPRRARGAAKKSVGEAKYRDPASGKTWTGHGRAPDWIKNASDRSAFLIQASGEGAAAAEAAPAAAAKRKPAKKARRSAAAKRK